jgi:hypothetical protein
MARKKILLLFISFLLTGCYSNQMNKYYSDEDNYTEIIGIIDNIEYNENYKALYITIRYDKQEYDRYKSYDGVFKIIDENDKILKENSFYDEVNIGDKVTFTTAPKVFGDGYFLPIVSVEANEKIYLDFEKGKENLLNSIEK